MVQSARVCVLQLIRVVEPPVLRGPLSLLGLLQGLLRCGHGLLRCGHGLLWRCQEANSRQQDVAVWHVVAAGMQAGSLQWQLGRQSSNAGRCTEGGSGQLCLLGSPRLLSCEADLLWQQQESTSQLALSCR